jgi:hypothetical protein
VSVGWAHAVAFGDCSAYSAHQEQHASGKKCSHSAGLVPFRVEAQATDNEEQCGSDVGDDLDPFERPAAAAAMFRGP